MVEKEVYLTSFKLTESYKVRYNALMNESLIYG